jgi:hypothetical protein
VGARLQGRVTKGARVTAGLLLAMAAVVTAGIAATRGLTGASLREACVAVGIGIGWGGLTFACGWWLAARKRERVAVEVAEVLAPVVKELKHLRGALAQRGSVDELARTSVHPRRITPESDDAKTVVASLHQLREAVR